MMTSVGVEEDAGDDEQGRHRQHVRKCLRGRPLGGFLHAGLSLNLGATHRGARYAQRGQNFHSEHPTATSIRLLDSPHLANIVCVTVEQQ